MVVLNLGLLERSLLEANLSEGELSAMANGSGSPCISRSNGSSELDSGCRSEGFLTASSSERSEIYISYPT